MKRNYVGIDVSKDKLDFAIKDGSTKQVANSEEGINKALVWLKTEAKHNPKVVVESTSWYHWLVCLLLTENNYDVRLINPLITKKYQKSSIRDAKNDKIDAYRLAEIGYLESGLAKFFDSRQELKNRRIQTLISNLEKTKQRFQRSLRDTLKSLETIDIEVDLSAVEEALKAIELALKTCKSLIQRNANELAKKLALTPGISLYQASTLTIAVSGKTFTKREKLVAFFGLDVRVRQSGRWQGNSCLSKRGNAYYRKILFQIGWSLQRHNERFREYYDRLRAKGKHYYTAIIATARKFLNYFFKLLTEFQGAY